MPKSKRRRLLGTKRAPGSKLDPPQPTFEETPPQQAHSQPPSRDATTQWPNSQPPPRHATTQPSQSSPREDHPYPTRSKHAPRDGPFTSLDLMPKSKHRRLLGTKRATSTKLYPPQPTCQDASPLPAHSQLPSRDATTQQEPSRPPPRDATTQPTHSQSLPQDDHPLTTCSQHAPRDGPSTSQDPMPKSKHPRLLGTKMGPRTRLDPLQPTRQDAPPLPAHSQSPSKDATTLQVHSQTPIIDATTQPTHSPSLPREDHPYPTRSKHAPRDGPFTSLDRMPKSKRPELLGTKRASSSTKLDPLQPTCGDPPPLPAHSQPSSRGGNIQQAHSQPPARDATTQPTHSPSLPQEDHPHPTHSQRAPRDGPSSQDPMPRSKRPRLLGTKRAPSTKLDPPQPTHQDAPPLPAHSESPSKDASTQRAYSQPPLRDVTTQPGHSHSSPQDAHPDPTHSQLALRDGPSTSQDPLQDTQVGSATETDDPEANNKQTKQRSSWTCQVIDKDGVIKEKDLKVKEVWCLRDEKVVVECDKEGRPVDDVGGLFSGVVGLLARTKFPIGVKNWHQIDNSFKDGCIDTLIMPYFHFENEKLGSWFTKQALGRRWRNYRLCLYNANYDPHMTREQNIDKNCPHGITKEQWASYIDIRADKKHKEMCKRNAENRSKLVIPHTNGSMSFARKKRQMEKESGLSVGRVKLWDATHRKKNGTYVNDKAKEVADKLNDALSQEHPSQHSIISPDDALGKVFGKEHPGRVRGLGLGVCPTSVFGGARLPYISYSSQDPKIQEEVKTLKSKLNDTQDKLNQTQDQVRFWESAFLSYIQEKEGYIPHQFASLVLSTQQADGRVSLQNPKTHVRSFDNGDHDETEDDEAVVNQIADELVSLRNRNSHLRSVNHGVHDETEDDWDDDN